MGAERWLCSVGSVAGGGGATGGDGGVAESGGDVLISTGGAITDDEAAAGASLHPRAVLASARAAATVGPARLASAETAETVVASGREENLFGGVDLGAGEAGILGGEGSAANLRSHES